MSTNKVHWGLMLPQGAHHELGGLSATEAWNRVLTAATEAERLGYDSVWTLDRTETLPRREPAPVFDGWTTLAALAQRTDRVGLGYLGLGAPLRDPALLAKRVACVDVMSGGRMMLALEADGYPPEHEAHGVPVPDRSARRAGVTETVEVLRCLWTEERVSTGGPYIHLDRAFSSPKPVNGPLPIHVQVHDGDGGSFVDPRAVGGVLWHDEPAQVRADVERLLRRCAESEVDPAHLERTVLLECRIFETTDERNRWLATPHVVIFWSEHPDLYMRRNLIGTTATVRDRVRAYLDAGATRFLLWFRDYPDLTSMRRFITEVAPMI